MERNFSLQVNKKRFEIFNLPIEEQKFEHIQFVFYIGTQVKEWYIGGGLPFYLVDPYQDPPTLTLIYL
jgi:hypothetical protein